ncbi:family 10 glycosylhydrolase [Flavobacteriaceae bacterium F89]|uniref:Family 10 glycosylhydrolase n=1 Tax=Cerina litoralis TaxID=2874477 RepID=A0AAE3EUN7_9FLAO|nr:family 10 glycosylhydrolase [Cerina litoralis]MCG2460464.1 family 10 glycosylhydrolase [Cerina litoralis]
MIKRILVLSLLTLTSCGVFKSNIPQPKREFRGVWVATVANIDWPKNGRDNVEKQKKDFIDILDFYQRLNFNAVIVQIRDAGDAFYPTELAPWSRFLSGTEGEAPEPYYDPLEWMIAEAHKRGMEFHAWLNPYRATMNENTEILAQNHDYNLYPDWMIKYGSKYYYNPGLPEVRQHLITIMDEVVTNYDVDAIHFDDYFYPYKIKDETFDDSQAYAAYALPQQSLADWRRANVDSLVQDIHKTIKKRKPWVQFGISPFGVWKNKSTDPRGSDTEAGQTNYDDLYADPLMWMQEGWIDYLVPQIYWSMDYPVASYRKIADWWAQNKTRTNLYIGNGAYKVRNNADKAWDKKKELPNQILLARKNSAIEGNVFFSAKSLMQDNSDVLLYLKKKYYAHPALTPISPLANKSRKIWPTVRKIKEENGILRFDLDRPEGEGDASKYVLVYAARNARQLKSKKIKWLVDKIDLENNKSFTLGQLLLNGKKHIAITFLDQNGRESVPVPINLNDQL